VISVELKSILRKLYKSHQLCMVYFNSMMIKAEWRKIC